MKCYYRFEQTSGNLENTASDVGSSDAISNSDLVVSNATQGATGKIDYGTTFASDTQTLKASNSAKSAWGFISNSGAVWTICGWIKGTAIGGDQAIVSTSDFGVNENGIIIRFSDTSGHILIILGTNGDDKFVGVSTSAAISDADWNFFMMQYDDSTGDVKLSINDGTVETIATGKDLTNTDEPSDFLYMGNTPALDNDFIGSLDEFVIFNRILTTDEITSLYNSDDGLVII